MPDGILPLSEANAHVPETPCQRTEKPAAGSGDLGRVGDYRLIRRIASGGTADVFEAEQDQPVRRRVALKRIKIGMDTREVVARFESERQALALLTHPYIARVYDAGETPEGRPYFVLEHVPGLTIRDYCDRHRLSLEARLRLFQQVCEGVQHAHQKGIIHRDLKSSNILVSLQDGAPHPKIIDFGVAKALHQRLGDDSVVTELGRVLGTPEYMSPEQAGFGPDIDTRTDVYSLGILLYELLTGTRPFERADAEESSVWKLIDRIREEEVPRPSERLRALVPGLDSIAHVRRTDAASLERTLRGDLDWIVLRSLEKDRTRRYSSASELSADIDRHLAGEPVLAGPPTTAYRARKFVRRHRVWVAGAAAVMLALVIGVVATSLMLARALRAERAAYDAKRLAQQEAETARRTSEFMVDLFQVTDPGEARGNTVTAREILDRGSDRIRRELHDQPLVRARLLGTMGSVYRGLGLYDVARPLLIEAVQVRERSGAPARELGVALNDLALAHTQAGDYREGAEVARRALAIHRRELGERHVQTAWSRYHLGVCLARSGDLEAGRTLFEASLPVFRSTLGDRSIAVSWCLNDLGTILVMREQYDLALTHLEGALRIKQDLVGLDHPEVALSYNNLAWVQIHRGRHVEAEKAVERALQIARRALGLAHPDLAIILHTRAELRRRRGDLAGAERDLESAVTIQADNRRSAELALSLWTLGAVRSERGLYALAEKDFRRSVALLEGLHREHPELIPCMDAYAELLERQGRASEAARARRRAAEIRAVASEVAAR